MNETFGERLRRLRKARGMTMNALAEMLGVPPASISRLERGKIQYNQRILEALSVALRVAPSELLESEPLELEITPEVQEMLRRVFSARGG